ncbi:GNAT family N-acetyltransferase [Mesorhizobium sp. LHD-90]|uniref:GNAT family N-acetyltransferase n=1 Tax=Mesorhizobium sp. LHD-90 TaxID=3071414 RepID=UPI0027E0C485|nr:GNAT family N-acetyltransferase [Mesorhizobium sp. LHD-90]MDQ6437999.1 GNAT family N-acetyltransferase [Mesorhizobium sp. LHD-90]
MPPKIRPARVSDLDALVAVEQAVFDADRISRRSWRTLLARPSAAVLVAADGGQIAGCCVILFRAGSDVSRLYSIAAAPGRSGIGRALLAEAEQAAARRGAKTMRLEVREDNVRAIGLYEKSGYRRFGRKPDYYADGAAALRFERPLAAEDRHGSPPGAERGTTPP